MEGRLYTPGAGHRPPVLAGRDELLRDWQLTCADVASVGRIGSDDLVLVGPRGVGKTAALHALAEAASTVGFETISLQAVRGRHGLIDSLVQLAERRVREGHPAWSTVRENFAAIAGVSAAVFGVGGGITFQKREAPSRYADAGTIAETLQHLTVALAKGRASGGLLLTIDELQMAGDDLSLLAAVLHRLNVDHPQARVLFAGTGLPNTREAMVAAGVTHADRLFDFVTLDVHLAPADARYALVRPAQERGVVWDHAAVERIVAVTGGYPSHLQAFAHEAWVAAAGPDRITAHDAEVAVRRGAARFERRAMRPRWEEMSDRQREYLTALAVAGGQARSAEVSAILGQTTQATSQTRAALIAHGDIYAVPGHRVAFSVPLAAAFALANYPLALETSELQRGLSSLDQMRDRAARMGVPQHILQGFGGEA